MFNKIEINIPFHEALDQMPNHTKFLKDIMSKKKKFSKKMSGEFDSYMQCNDTTKLTNEDAGS